MGDQGGGVSRLLEIKTMGDQGCERSRLWGSRLLEIKTVVDQGCGRSKLWDLGCWRSRLWGI